MGRLAGGVNRGWGTGGGRQVQQGRCVRVWGGGGGGSYWQEGLTQPSTLYW